MNGNIHTYIHWKPLSSSVCSSTPTLFSFSFAERDWGVYVCDVRQSGHWPPALCWIQCTLELKFSFILSFLDSFHFLGWPAGRIESSAALFLDVFFVLRSKARVWVWVPVRLAFFFSVCLSIPQNKCKQMTCQIESSFVRWWPASRRSWLNPIEFSIGPVAFCWGVGR